MGKVNNKKKELQIFTIADYEAEEKYLREQHKKGWKLVKVKFPGIYTFESCKPQDVVYRLDFADVPDRDKPSYLQLFKDNGWEYLSDMAGWSYFRKPKRKYGEDLSIFSDAESKLDMIKRIYKKRLIPLIVIFLCCVVPGLGRIGVTGASEHTSYILLGMYVALFVIYMLIFTYCGSRLKRLQKQLEK